MRSKIRSTLCLLWLLSLPSLGGEASLLLVDRGGACNDNARVVDVKVDLTGQTDDKGQLLGLNGFVFALDLDAPVLTNIFLGDDPVLAWRFQHTELERANTSGRLLISGFALDNDAPAGLYHLVTLYLSGQDADVLLSLDAGASSLAGKANGAVPGQLIPFTAPPALTLTISAGGGLQLEIAAAQWRDSGSEYDYDGNAVVDIRDLVQLQICSGSN